ncbi:hypothetical protein CaO19.5082 [Kluyveromyces marxianus]|nr:hypothetical protein CaO19.5082 [Kluyveromyces marxianus]
MPQKPRLSRSLPLLLLPLRRICVLLSVVSWVMSILVRQSCWIRLDKPMSKVVKPVVLLNKLVPHTSLSKLLNRRPLSWPSTKNKPSMSQVCWLSIPQVTNLSLTCVLEVLLYVTLQSWLSISCMV